MHNIHVRPSRDLRNKYLEIRKILEEHDQVIITNNGIGEAVLINFDDYKEYEDYLRQRQLDSSMRMNTNSSIPAGKEWFTNEEFWKVIDYE